MRNRIRALVLATAGLATIAASTGLGFAVGVERTPIGSGRAVQEPPSRAKSFTRAELIIEVNGTDGDAGLQVNLDGEPWKVVAIFRPDGSEILEYRTRSDVRGFGMTELFSESSEPPFTRFPLDEFKALFPEGEYRLVGRTIDGDRVVGTAILTHDIPEGPVILTPEDGATVSTEDARIRWRPAPQPDGVEIVGYRVTFERADPLRIFNVDLPADARSVRIPAGYLESGVEYSAEVLAIDAGGNQTLTSIDITAG